MLVLKLGVMIIMVIGLYCTVFPRIPGTLIIFTGAAAYWWFTGFVTYQPWLAYVLIAAVAVAEAGLRALRAYVTGREDVTRTFSTDTTVGNMAGLIVSEAILGPSAGTILWELLVGKALFSRWTSVAKILKRLILVAVIRFCFGLVMIYLIIEYVFL